MQVSRTDHVQDDYRFCPVRRTFLIVDLEFETIIGIDEKCFDFLKYAFSNVP